MQKCTITRRGQGSFDASRLYFNSPKFRQASCSQSLLALSNSVVSGSWVNDMKAITNSCEARNAMKFHFCICKDNPWWNWKRSAAHHQKKTCKMIWTMKLIFCWKIESYIITYLVKNLVCYGRVCMTLRKLMHFLATFFLMTYYSRVRSLILLHSVAQVMREITCGLIIMTRKDAQC